MKFIVLDSTPVSLSRYEGIRTLAKLFFCFRTIRKLCVDSDAQLLCADEVIMDGNHTAVS